MLRTIWARSPGQVPYDIGDGRAGSCSLVDTVDSLENTFGREFETRNVARAQLGDQVWCISNTADFESDYPLWAPRQSLADIITELVEKKRGA